MITTEPSSADGHLKRPRYSFLSTEKPLAIMPDNLDQAAAATAEDEQVSTHRIALQSLLHHQRQISQALAHVRMPGGNSPVFNVALQ